MSLKEHRKVFNALIWIPVGVFIIAFFAQITVNMPWRESFIPVTGQSFAVLCMALLSGRWIGVGAAFLYLVLGATGLPVFAGEGSGINRLIGISGGYLYSFPFAAYLVGGQGDMKWNRSIPFSMIALALGTMVILFLGVFHMSFYTGIITALREGLIPLLPGAFIKLIAGALLVPLILKIYDQSARKKSVRK